MISQRDAIIMAIGMLEMGDVKPALVILRKAERQSSPFLPGACPICGSLAHREVCDSPGAMATHTTGCPEFDLLAVDKTANPQGPSVDKLSKLQDRDGVRYRWLRNNMTYTDRGPFTIGTLMAPKVRRWYHDSPITGIDTLDAAIDQAMLIQQDDQP